jgi:YVTN family beta-propeller protein
VTVVRTADNVVIATIPVGRRPIGIAVTPDSQYVYVATSEDNTVSVIRGSDHTVITTIDVGEWPYGIATTPGGDYVYVTSIADDTMSVIRTSDSTVTATVPVGTDPYSLGTFIANVPDGPTDDPADPGLASSSSSSSGGGGGCFIGSAANGMTISIDGAIFFLLAGAVLTAATSVKSGS